MEWAGCLLLELPHSAGCLFLSGFLVEEDSAAARHHSSSCKWTHKSSGDFDFWVCSCRSGFCLFVCCYHGLRTDEEPIQEIRHHVLILRF